jgi:hypothetical protein
VRRSYHQTNTAQHQQAHEKQIHARVEESTDLQSWQTLAAPVYAIDGAVTATASVPNNSPQRFFRVIAPKPPEGEE